VLIFACVNVPLSNKKKLNTGMNLSTTFSTLILAYVNTALGGIHTK
jgi:hypothetical protein